nr:hypothetical protein CFP56_70955 [Quercus suber]
MHPKYGEILLNGGAFVVIKMALEMKKISAAFNESGLQSLILTVALLPSHTQPFFTWQEPVASSLTLMEAFYQVFASNEKYTSEASDKE